MLMKVCYKICRSSLLRKILVFLSFKKLQHISSKRNNNFTVCKLKDVMSSLIPAVRVFVFLK